MNTIYLFLCINFALLVGALSNVRLTSTTQNTRNNSNNVTATTLLPQQFSYVCNSELFYHDYLKKVGEFEPVKNSWNSARVNKTATLFHICLMPNGLPVTRKCLFHPQLGAVWESTSNWTRIRCIKEAREQIITPELRRVREELLKMRSSLSLHDKQQAVHKTFEILKKPKYKFLPADVYHTTQIIHDVVTNSNDVELSRDIVGICNTVMSVEDKVLQLSAKLNSTNVFLEDFENYLNALRKKFVPSSRCNLSTITKISSTLNKHSDSKIRRADTIEEIDFSYIGVYAYLTENISIFFVNPTCANVTGIAVYDLETTSSHQYSKNRYKSQGNFYYRFVYSNETATDLMKEPGIQIATFLPGKLWNYVKEVLPIDDQYIIVKIYTHDSLFVQTGEVQNCRPSSKIISISIPEFSGRFPEPLPFLVRTNYNKYKDSNAWEPATGCGYWNYETWLRDDVETTSLLETNGSIVLCGTRHLTQFTYLLGGQYRQNNLDDDILISPQHIQALDIISIVGCSLSLMGLLGIWITAALFKFWRSLSSTQVLLNMCFPLTIKMILFLFVNTDDISQGLVREKAYIPCIFLGAVLQYIILVLFTWMLLIAFLQFQRYVTIIGIDRPHRYILKAAIIAWSFPLIPTLIGVFVNPKGYIPLDNEEGMCYPSGYGLVFGVIFPITIICIANLTIFIYVFYSISHTLNQSMQRQEKLMVAKQIRLSILLFFLLGICWVFGIFAFMSTSLVFSYLFCFTATLQGFVLFLYFVVFNSQLRRAWYGLFCSSSQQKVQSKVHEMQSITTSSAIDSRNDRRS